MEEEMKNRLQYAMNMTGKKAVDLSNALGIPKSAISQYLSGRSKKMPSERLYAIAKYLDVSEAWLMGFDVPMERPAEQKENDELVALIDRLKTEKGFRTLILSISKLNPDQLEGLMKLMNLT